MEQRRIVRRFGTPKPVVQEADPEDEPQETQDDEPEEEETQPVVRRRLLSQPTTPAKAAARTPVAPSPAARVVARKGTLLVEDEPEEDKIILKAGKRPVHPAIRPVDDDDDLEEDPKPVLKALRKAVVIEESEDVIEELEEEDVKEAPKAKPQPFPEPALEKFRIRSVNETVAGDVFNQIFEAMAAGTSIIVTKLEENKWQFTSTNIQAAAVEKSTGLKLGNGKAYFAEVLNPNYVKFYDEWNNLTYDEKRRRAKKAGTAWKEDKNPKMDSMRMTEAYLEKLGIKKYKPEYQDAKKRAAIRG